MNYLKRPIKKDEEDTQNKQMIRQVVDSSQESEDQGSMPTDDGLDATDMSQDMPADSSDSELSPQDFQQDDQPMDDMGDDAQAMDDSLDEELPEEDMDEEDPEMMDESSDEEMPEDMDEEMSEDDGEDMGDEDFQDGEPQHGGMIYIAGDGDGIGSHVGQAVLHDDEQALHEISNAINEGQQTVIEWTESNGGTVISAGGDEFVAILPEELYEQLEDLREAYAQIVGATLTIGVGSSMSEAGKSLIYGKLNGKDQISHYDPSMEDFLDQSQNEQPSDREKYDEHYLDSVYDHEASPDQDPSMDPAMADDMAAPAQKIEEDQVAELPESGEMQKDEQSLRDKMLNVVESFRSEKETIEATQQQNPELYQAFMTTLAAMMDLARKMGPAAGAPDQPETAEVPPEQADMSAPLQQPEDPAAGEPQGQGKAVTYLKSILHRILKTTLRLTCRRALLQLMVV